MSSLQVLCPNGRRQNVKITPNTKLLQVLEEVCQKQKFLPSEDYKLIHGRTSLDLTLSVRFSNLANNAKLELVKSEKSRAESEVVIALQLENGERHQHRFSPGTTLWDLLQLWENEPNSQLEGKLTNIDGSHSPPLQPVCIYMTEEVCGEQALRNTQLRKLGLVGGRAVLRYVKRPVDEKMMKKPAEMSAKDRTQTQAQDLNPAKRQASRSESTESEIKTQSTSSVLQTNSSDMVTQSTVIETQSGTKMETQTGTKIIASTTNVTAEGKPDIATISLNINVNIQNDNKQGVQDENECSDEPVSKMVKTEEPSDNSEPMEVEHTDMIETVMETEETGKVTSQQQGPALQKQEEAAESLRNLNIPGLEVFTPQDFLDLPPDQQQVAQRLAAALLPKLLAGQMQGQGQSVRTKSKEVKPKPRPPSQAGFADFKFPEETKGKQLYKNELSEYRKEDFKPCDRNTTVYSLLESQEQDANGTTVTVKTEELPEEFFDLTESDMRSLISAQKKKMDEMENQPLMTSAMRKARIESMYSKYDRVVIRVQFPDKLVLQGFFRPRETVFAVQKFIKENLKNRDIPFYLYTSPPKCVLKDESQTLIEAQLVPATIIYFGSSQHEDNYLSDSSISNIKSRLDADKLATECLRSLELQNDADNQLSASRKGKQPVQKRSQSNNQDSQQSSDDGQPSTSSSKNVPKWFKIGKK